MEDICIVGDVENFLIYNNEAVLFRDWLVNEMDKISRLINCLYRCAYKSLVDKGMCPFATFVRSMIFDWQKNRDILTKRKFLGLYDIVSVTHWKLPFMSGAWTAFTNNTNELRYTLWGCSQMHPVSGPCMLPRNVGDTNSHEWPHAMALKNSPTASWVHSP